MKRLYVFLMTLILVFGISVSANATLISMGDGTIYDTDLQLSWLKDANTTGAAITWPMSWSDAKTWADNLVYAGFNDWRLPSALNQDGSGPCIGYRCTGSEMGHLYYTELGNSAGGPLANVGDFINLKPDLYWSGTEYASDPGYAWYFNFSSGVQSAYQDEYFWVLAVRSGATDCACAFYFYNGSQVVYGDDYSSYALTVHPGDGSTSVPEPATLLLLGAGLAGIGVWRKRLGRSED